MKDLVKSLENLPLVVRVLLILLWGAYGNLIRIFKSIAANNVLAIVLSVVLFIFGGWIIWIIDLVCVLTNRPIWWIC